jgi:hypothetical protein
MSPILLLKCKTKILSSISMILFGIALFLGGSFLVYTGGSWWWTILILFGIFCVWTWSSILYKGSMTLVFFVKDELMYFTYDRTKIVLNRLDEIKETKFYTHSFELHSIQNFWRYVLKVNGGTTTDNLHFMYEGEKIELADLNANEVELNDKDLKEIAIFLHAHNPHISIGKP